MPVAFDGVVASERVVGTAEEWARLIDLCGMVHSVQAFGYGEAKAQVGWRPLRLAYEIEGRDVAVVLALQRRLVGVPLVTRINRGPMFLGSAPERQIVLSVLESLRWNRGHLLFGGPLVIAPALADTPDNRSVLAEAGFHPTRRQGWASARLDLTRPLEAIFDSFAHNWRKSIRFAQKAGVRVVVEESAEAHEWMIERHLDNMREKGFHGHGAKFLRALRAYGKSDYVLLRAFHEGVPVAGLTLLRVGATADSIVAWFGQQGRKVKAGNLLTWSGIIEMQRRGCLLYDVGGINSEAGFRAFKAGMNGQEYHLVNEYVSF